MKLPVLRLYLLLAWGGIVFLSITAFMPQVTEIASLDTSAYPLNNPFIPIQQSATSIAYELPTATDPTSITVQCIDADLVITKTVASTFSKGNRLITYTITVTNKGPDLATGVRVTDTLPASLVYGRNIASQGTYSDVTGIWNVENLTKDDLAILIITATLQNCPEDQHLITNTAYITANQLDRDQNNNIATASLVIDNLCDPGPGDPVDLAIDMTVDSLQFGTDTEFITYTITVTNNGPGYATGVRVTDTLETGLDIEGFSAPPDDQVYFSEQTLSWDIGELSSSTTTTLLFTTTLEKCSGHSTLDNNARVTSSEIDTVPSNNSITETFSSSLIMCCIYLPIIQSCPPFYDTFNSESSGWPREDFPGFIPRYLLEEEEYQILTTNTGLHYVYNLDLVANNYNYEVEVDARWQSESSTGKAYGIIFGLVDDDYGELRHAYLFQVNADRQKYRLLRFNNGSWNILSNSTDIGGWIPETNIIEANPTTFNHLKVGWEDGLIRLFINGEELEPVSDDEIEIGWAGLSVERYDNDPDYGTRNANVRFDNYTFHFCPTTTDNSDQLLSLSVKRTGGTLPSTN